MTKMMLGSLIGLLFASGALAQVSVTDPWVRGTVSQQKATGAFMKLSSASPVRLVQAQSPVAGTVEIHEMRVENNVMKMRAVPGIDLPAGQAVELKPGGYHVMLMDLKQPMKDGDTVPITLVFTDKDNKRQTLEVSATVRPLTAPAGKMDHKHH